MARLQGTILCVLLICLMATAESSAQVVPAKGEIKGAALKHTPQSALGVVDQANVVLPVSVTRGAIFVGKWKESPSTSSEQVPVVIFLHGSTGLGLKAIGEWQHWLAEHGIASVAPDSFALPDRVTYTSPIDKATYESIHALRTSEIDLALAAVTTMPWARQDKIVLAGASEGGSAVARYGKPGFAARIIYSWSCENNYFVQEHRTQVLVDQPILNVISSVDPFFSQANLWLGNPTAKGNCAEAFAANKRATVVLIPGAPHTLINLPQARSVTRSFLDETLKR